MKGHVKTVEPNKHLLVYDLPRLNGKRRQKMVTFHGTLREADKELRKLIATAESGNYVSDDKITLGAYLSRWMNAQIKMSPGTRDSYTRRFKMDLTTLFDVKLQKLSALRLQETYAEILRSGRIQTQTLRITHVALREALDQAVTWGLLTKNPASLVEVDRGDPKKKKILTPDGTFLFAEKLQGTSMHMPVLLMVHTGIRRGEALGLRWQDVDLDNHRIAIEQQVARDGKTWVIAPPKTDRSRRTIPIPRVLAEALKAYRTEQLKRRMKLDEPWHDMDIVCDRGDGRYWNPSSFNSTFNHYRKKFFMPIITPHSLRHGHASTLGDAGASLAAVSERLGNTKEVTAKTYTHAFASAQDGAAKKMDELYERHQQKNSKKKGTS